MFGFLNVFKILVRCYIAIVPLVHDRERWNTYSTEVLIKASLFCSLLTSHNLSSKPENLSNISMSLPTFTYERLTEGNWENRVGLQLYWPLQCTKGDKRARPIISFPGLGCQAGAPFKLSLLGTSNINNWNARLNAVMRTLTVTLCTVGKS